MRQPFHRHESDPSEPGAIERSTSPQSAMTGGRGEVLRVPASIVAKIHARDVTAFQELIRQTSPSLLRYGTSLLGSLDDAEDIVQDVFTAVWELGTHWNPTGDPIAYLLSSVRNRARNELLRRSRAERRIQQTYPSHEAVPDHDRTVLNQLIDAEEATQHMQRITAILATLPERQQTAYELRYRQGLPATIVAEVLGVSVKGAESLILRVTRTLLKRLGREGPNP